MTKVESGGRLWRPIVNRVLLCAVFMSLLMVLTIGLSEGWIKSISAAPPILIVIAFKIALRSRFQSFQFYIPSDDEIAACTAHHNDDRKHRLAKRFGCVN